MTPIASSIHNLSKTDGLMNCGTMQSQQMTCEEALGARYLKDVKGLAFGEKHFGARRYLIILKCL